VKSVKKSSEYYRRDERRSNKKFVKFRH